MNKLYDLLKYIIYASFYMIVIKTGMDFYGYKRFPKLYVNITGTFTPLVRIEETIVPD